MWRAVGAYAVVAFLLWAAVLESGIHATLAEVVLGALTPSKAEVEPEVFGETAETLLERARTAATESRHDEVQASLGALASPVALGVALGLLIGKAVGVTAVAWLVVKVGIASLPTGVTWTQVTGAGLLAGIGFTVALFIAQLAFADPVMVKPDPAST